MVDSAQPIVRLESVSKSYRRGTQLIEVLRDISLDILEGEFVALMGPSGSGKTTVLNLVAGIDRPDTGKLFVGGTDIAALSESQLSAWRANHVGFIFQFYNLIPVLNALENVELPLLLTSLSRADRREHAVAPFRPWDWPTGWTITRASCQAGSSRKWPLPGLSSLTH